MTSTRIHDLAVDLGISAEQLLKLLADLGIHVRSHLSALDAGQVALVRTRWEREKRKKDEPEPKKGRRRAAPAVRKTVKKEEVEQPADRPRRRRRTAAEVAAREAAAEEERQREAAEVAMTEVTLKVEPLEPKPSLEERAAALFVEPPVAVGPEPDGETGAAAAANVSAPVVEAARDARSESVVPSRAQRPAPARIKPVASAAPGASAAPPRRGPRRAARGRGGA